VFSSFGFYFIGEKVWQIDYNPQKNQKSPHFFVGDLL